MRQAELAGALRRRAETVDRLVVAVGADDPARALDHVARYPRGASRRSTRDGERRDIPRLASGLLVESETAEPAAFPALLHALTGSEAHRARLGRAREASGVSCWTAGTRPRQETAGGFRSTTEADLYRHLGLPYLPPEATGGRGRPRDWRPPGAAPAVWSEESDIQGIVHCHTVYSDGADTVEEMARAAQAMGMRYITITDHSPTASYAGGLTLDRLRRQWDEIAKAQEKVKGLQILRGTESDILADGGLDYPDAVLEQLDIVIASIHNRHRMDETQMTRRLVRAMRHPCFKVWGHALGRYVLRRPPDRLPDGGGAGRRRRVAGGDRGERKSPSPRHGAALAARGPPPRPSLRRVDRRALHRRAAASRASGSTWRGGVSWRRRTC